MKMKYNFVFQLVISCLILLSNPLGLKAISPSSSRNYIITYAPNIATNTLSGLTDQSTCPVIQYFDGLGKPIQTIAVGVTPLGKDLVSSVEYDDFGRDFKTWIPTISEGAGAYISINTLNSNDNPFSIKIYDDSPLNKVIKDYGPGANWQNNSKGIVHEWFTNNNNSDYLKAYIYSVTSDNKLKNGGLFSNRELYVTKQVDEDGNQSWTFKDKLDRTILTRSFNNIGSNNGNGYFDTYYVFDELDRLRYVLSPMASDNLTSITTFDFNNDFIIKYAYYYQYDSRGNCIEKRLPGANSISMIYDKANRLVLTQDGNQKEIVMKNNSRRWMFTKYDVLGRTIMRGTALLPANATPNDLNSVYQNRFIVETFNTSSYTDTSYNYPGSERESVLEIDFYDGYGFKSATPGNRPTDLNWQTTETLDPCYSSINAKGLLSGKIESVIGIQAQKKYSAFYYDKKRRVVQRNGTNYYNALSNYTYGHERYSFAYTFQGDLKESAHRNHAVYLGPTYLEGTINTYDHAGRVKKVQHYFGSKSSLVTTLQNTYNELGQLRTKTYGNNLETQTYDYNIRGWLKNIDGGIFSEQLTHEETGSRYNGNITKAYWKRLTGNIHTQGWQDDPSMWAEHWESMSFSYDGLNRLLGGTSDWFQKMGESLTYDKNGNIKSLMRGGIYEHLWIDDENSLGTYPDHNYKIIDNICYFYDGNHLKTAEDYLGNSNDDEYEDPTYYQCQDFKDNAHTTIEYGYDYNGNMCFDKNKRIATLKYNFLNLPDTVQMENGCMANFIYGVSGEKYTSIHRTVTGSGPTMPIGSTLYNYPTTYTINPATRLDYYDNIVYEANMISKILIDDGLIMNPLNSNIKDNYHYYLKDHLGNVRAVIHDDGFGKPIVDQVNNYYPFGMEYGESAENQAELEYQNYLYGGKEFDRSFGMNYSDFGARNFDNGRWTTMDPMAEIDYSVSPYVYCHNNPFNRIDPTGMFDDQSIDEVTVTGYTSNNNYTFLTSSIQTSSSFNQNQQDNTFIDRFPILMNMTQNTANKGQDDYSKETKDALTKVSEAIAVAGIAKDQVEIFVEKYAGKEFVYVTIKATNAVVLTEKLLTVLKNITIGTIVLGAIVDATGSVINPTKHPWSKTIASTVVSASALIIAKRVSQSLGGTIGIGYFVLDQMGAFKKRPFISPSIYAKPLMPADATRVVQ